VQESAALEDAKLAVGGINRVLFPLSILCFVWVAKMILAHWQHVGILTLVNKLLLAMAAVRLVVYAMRYIFSGGLWLKTLENFIAWVIWGVLALHLTGFLPYISESLEAAEFSIGKNQINLLMITQGLFTVLLTLLVALWVSRLIENKLMRAEHVSINLRVVIVKLIRILFIVLAVLIAMSAVGLDITLLSVFGGALGVGLGLGLQKIASNYVSGFIILLDKSMKIGDVITIENHYGVISDLRSRYLVLRKLDGTEVVIPNETFITSAVINHSFSDTRSRVQLPIQVSYESNLDTALKIMESSAKKQPRVIGEPAPAAFVVNFGESGIDLMLNIWILDPEEGSSSLKSDLYREIWRQFQKQGVVIPYPQREVRMLAQ
jgi:small-conductance mechanosensitive channel